MSVDDAKLVLASASPRRLALIEQVGISPDLLNPVDIDETPLKRESPRALSLRLAREKAAAARSSALVRNLGDNTYILSADTVVCVGRRVVDKPQSAEEAREGLLLLSGRSHRVFTSITLVAPGGREMRASASVRARIGGRRVSCEVSVARRIVWWVIGIDRTTGHDRQGLSDAVVRASRRSVARTTTRSSRAPGANSASVPGQSY